VWQAFTSISDAGSSSTGKGETSSSSESSNSESLDPELEFVSKDDEDLELDKEMSLQYSGESQRVETELAQLPPVGCSKSRVGWLAYRPAIPVVVTWGGVLSAGAVGAVGNTSKRSSRVVPLELATDDVRDICMPAQEYRSHFCLDIAHAMGSARLARIEGRVEARCIRVVIGLK